VRTVPCLGKSTVALAAPRGLLVGRGRGCFAAGLKPGPRLDEKPCRHQRAGDQRTTAAPRSQEAVYLPGKVSKDVAAFLLSLLAA
jgi:hypothetical protein